MVAKAKIQQFLTFCQQDNLEMTAFQEYVSSSKITARDIRKYECEAIKCLIRKEEPHMLQWLIQHTELTPKDIKSNKLCLLCEACAIDNQEMLDWLLKFSEIRAGKDLAVLLSISCQSNNIPNLKLLLSRGSILKKACIDSDCPVDSPTRAKLIWEACANSCTDAAEYLILRYGIGTVHPGEYDIHNLFSHSAVDIIGWFLNFTNTYDDFLIPQTALYNACEHNSAEVIEYLFNHFVYETESLRLNAELNDLLIEATANREDLTDLIVSFVNRICAAGPDDDASHGLVACKPIVAEFGTMIPVAILERFQEICGEGIIEDIQAYIDENHIDKFATQLYNNMNFLADVCTSGNLDAVKWMHNYFEFDNDDLHHGESHHRDESHFGGDYYVLNLILSWKYYDIAEWLINTFEITKEVVIRDRDFMREWVDEDSPNWILSIQWIIDRFDLTAEDTNISSIEFAPDSDDEADDYDVASDFRSNIDYSPDRVRIASADLGPKYAAKC